MSIKSLGTTDAVTLGPQATAADAARLMEERNVGSVVLVEDDRPTGIVTDRDLVLRVLRKGRDPHEVALASIVAKPLVTASEDLALDEAAWRMREHAIRRLPVVDAEGRLVGIVTLDDLVGHLEQLPRGVVEVLSSFHAPFAFV